MPHLTGPLQMPSWIRTRRLQPEKRLLIACLDMALRDWWKFTRAAAQGKKTIEQLVVETEIFYLRGYFAAEDNEPFSFRWLCEGIWGDPRPAMVAIRRIVVETDATKRKNLHG